MQIRLERVKSIGRKIGLNDEKGYVVAVFLVLIIVSALAVTYFVAFRPQPAGYNTIFILDSQKTADNYPVTLVANQNSTFNVWLSVENHIGTQEKYQIQTKITTDASNLPIGTQPINTTDITVDNGQSWQNIVTVTQNQVGNYSVVFELWQLNSSGIYQFTNNYCVLNIQVIS
jgi:uncharacterized membrane protein